MFISKSLNVYLKVIECLSASACEIGAIIFKTSHILQFDKNGRTTTCMENNINGMYTICYIEYQTVCCTCIGCRMKSILYMVTESQVF